MADFEGSLPIKTVRDDDVKLKIVDWASGSEATNGWSIDANGAGLVRAVELDIRALAFATDKVDVSGSDVVVSATAFDIRALSFATDKVDVSGSSVEVTGSVTVAATDLDIRDLAFATDKVDVSGSSVQLTDGTHVASVNSDGSLNVAISSGDLVHVAEYFTSAAVAKNATEEYDYVVPSGAEFRGENILVGSRGAVKIEFGIFDGTDFNLIGTCFQLPANNTSILIPSVEIVGDGIKAIRMRVTNLDSTTALYCTLQGVKTPAV